jgi:hypothetical protein
VSGLLGCGPSSSGQGDSARPGNPPGAKGAHTASNEFTTQRLSASIESLRSPATAHLCSHYTFGAFNDEPSDASAASEPLELGRTDAPL